MKSEKFLLKVLVLGSSGSLGNKIFYELKKNKNIQLFHSGLNKRKLDFTNKLNLKEFVLYIKPHLIINCIANTNIEDCEKKKLISKKINYKIVKEILNLKNYKNFDFKFIHFSTDQFYDTKLKKNKNIQLFHSGLNKRKLDFSNKLNLKEFVLNIKPHLIINCIANTNIEDCEKNKLISKKINYRIVKEILNLKNYKNFDFKCIHFSTDQFYDNELNKENSKIFLNNNYCIHKRMAEIECLKKNCLVFRINFFGKSLKNKSFSDWVYYSFKQRNKTPVYLFNDVFFNPLRITTIAKIISLIIKEKKYKNKGIFNLGSKKGMSKSEFALLFAKKTKVFNSNFKFIHANELLKTKRSNNMIMDVRKFEKKFLINLPNISQEINNEARDYTLK